MVKNCPKCKGLKGNCYVCDGKGQVYGVKEEAIRKRMGTAHLYDLERDGWQAFAFIDPTTKLRQVVFPDKDFLK